MKHYLLTAHGRVQGVGFRWAVYQYASQRPISGYVQNMTNGTVRIDCQASEDELAALMAFVKNGPTPYARVTALDQITVPVDQQLTSFPIH